MGTFFARTSELKEMVGEDELVGSFSVHGGERTVPLHEGYWVNFKGTEGFKRIRNYNQGGPKFVEGPLKERYEVYYDAMASVVLEGGVREAMEECMEDLDDQLSVRAPIEFGALRKSGAYVVVDDGDPWAVKSPEAAPYE